MEQMKLTPHSVLVDEVWGKRGTSKREEMEAKLQAEVRAYYRKQTDRRMRVDDSHREGHS